MHSSTLLINHSKPAARKLSSIPPVTTQRIKNFRSQLKIKSSKQSPCKSQIAKPKEREKKTLIQAWKQEEATRRKNLI
jgi:hypothetical protein